MTPAELAEFAADRHRVVPAAGPNARSPTTGRSADRSSRSPALSRRRRDERARRATGAAASRRLAASSRLPAAVDRRDHVQPRQQRHVGRAPAGRLDHASLRRTGGEPAQRGRLVAVAAHRPAGRRVGRPACSRRPVMMACDALSSLLFASVPVAALARAVVDGPAARGRAADRGCEGLLRHCVPGLPAVPDRRGPTGRRQLEAARQRIRGPGGRARRRWAARPGVRCREWPDCRCRQLRRLGVVPAGDSRRRGAGA